MFQENICTILFRKWYQVHHYPEQQNQVSLPKRCCHFLPFCALTHHYDVRQWKITPVFAVLVFIFGIVNVRAVIRPVEFAVALKTCSGIAFRSQWVYFCFFVSGACFVVVSSSTMVYFPLLTIKTGITSVWRATIIYLIRVCLVIFCIGNNIYFILYHDGWSVRRRSIRNCLCIIFRNCPDMEDSVNSPIIALTNLSFTGVRLALFNALKASTGSSKRIW